MINKIIQVSTPVFVKASEFAGVTIMAVKHLQLLKRYWWFPFVLLFFIFIIYHFSREKEVDKVK